MADMEEKLSEKKSGKDFKGDSPEEGSQREDSGSHENIPEGGNSMEKPNGDKTSDNCEDDNDIPLEESPVEECVEDEQSEENMTWTEKKAAKKQAKLDKKTDAFKEKIEQLEDRVKRQMAEFENFRKRTDREKQSMYEIGAKSVIEKILPVVDNFERGLATVLEENKEDPFVDGMNRVYKQMLTELEGLGVKPIPAVGCEFDPELHNAVMQEESDELESGYISKELLKGYTYRDSVVRHSMVAVIA